MTASLISELEAASDLTFLQSARLQMKSRIDGLSPLDRGLTFHRGGLVKFRFVLQPLKDLPLGSIVEGFELVERSHTGKNAVGFCMKDGKFEKVLLIFAESSFILEEGATQTEV